MQSLLAFYRDATTAILRAAQAKGQLDPALDPLALGNTLISLYYGLELQLALDPGVDVDKYTEAVQALLRPAPQRP